MLYQLSYVGVGGRVFKLREKQGDEGYERPPEDLYEYVPDVAAELLGTHVNMALVLKFMAGYLFNPDPDLTPADRELEPSDNEFLFRQRPVRGLSKIRFSDWHAAFEQFCRRAKRRPIRRA